MSLLVYSGKSRRVSAAWEKQVRTALRLASWEQYGTFSYLWDFEEQRGGGRSKIIIQGGNDSRKDRKF